MPLIARAAAANDDVTMRRTVAQALTVAVVVGVSATATLELAATPLLSFLGAPPSSPLFEPADAYLRTRALAAPAVLLVAVGTDSPSLFLTTPSPVLPPGEGVQGWRACAHAQPGCPTREAPSAAARQLHVALQMAL